MLYFLLQRPLVRLGLGRVFEMGRVLVLPPSQGPVVSKARGATSLGEVGCLAGGGVEPDAVGAEHAFGLVMGYFAALGHVMLDLLW